MTPSATSYNISSIPLDKEVEHIEGEEHLQIKAEEGKATLVIFSKDSLLSFESEIKYRIAHQLNVDSRKIVMFGGIENLHEKAHMDILMERIKENTAINKIVVATAIKGKYNHHYLDRFFDYICPLKIISEKRK